MKKIRDQAHKDINAIKSNAQEKAKEFKAFAANAVDDIADANDAMYKQAGETKDSIMHAAHTAKADVKEFAKNVAADATAARDTVSEKAQEAKESIQHAAHAAKADIKADIKQAGQINKDISKGFGNVISDVKHTGHDVAEQVKHH